MRTETTGIIVGGVLQLDDLIDMPDKSRVRVAIEPLEEWRSRLRTGLEEWKQLCQEQPVNSEGRRYTRNQLHERR